MALVSPFGRVIALLESFKTLTSDASIGAKLLAGTLITLVTAYSALAIAKAFGVSKANGLAVAAAIGASIGTAVASITGTISFATTKYAEIKEQSQKSTNYDEVAKNSSNLSNTEYNTSKVPPIDITINTNVDGRTLAETTAHYNHDAMKKQNLI